MEGNTAFMNELYKKIVETEKSSAKKREMLKLVQKEITDEQQRINNLEEESTNLEEEICKEVNELSEKEVELECTKIRETILKEQSIKLRQEVEALLAELEIGQSELISLNDTMCKASSSFLSEYGPGSFLNQSSTNQKRVEEQRAKLTQIKAKCTQSEEELAAALVHINDLKKLKQTYVDAQMEASRLKAQDTRLEQQIRRAEEFLDVCQQAKQNTANFTATDPEFTRLSNEYKKAQEYDMESVYQALKYEHDKKVFQKQHGLSQAQRAMGSGDGMSTPVAGTSGTNRRSAGSGQPSAQNRLSKFEFKKRK